MAMAAYEHEPRRDPSHQATVSLRCEKCMVGLEILDDVFADSNTSKTNLRSNAQLYGDALLATKKMQRRAGGLGFNSSVLSTPYVSCSVSDSFVVLPHTEMPVQDVLRDCSTKEQYCKPPSESYCNSEMMTVRTLAHACKGDGWAINHPLCLDCLDAALIELEPIAAYEKSLARKYARALKGLKRSVEMERSVQGIPDNEETSDSSLKALDDEEAMLFRRVRAVEDESRRKEDECYRAMVEIAELQLWHLHFWFVFGNHQRRAIHSDEQKRSFDNFLFYISTEMQMLKQMNVTNDAFHIWTENFLPSINKCRIGRISSPTCPQWSEVNSGWGHLCVLLDVFYRKCNFHSSYYNLIPRGQFSIIIRKKDGAVLPLHGGGGEVGLSRFFYTNRRFDTAMMAFLECVQELVQHLNTVKRGVDTRLDSRICPLIELPYPIDGDKVGGFSIRLQLNQDERWSTALKNLLINMKWLLGYIEGVVSAPVRSKSGDRERGNTEAYLTNS